jgi:predicted phosphate transport protein (TIGR00153 family)
MFNRLMPKEAKFFDLFNAHANLIVDASKELVHLFDDLAHTDRHMGTIKDLEKRADRITYETVDLLHKTFITPLDRDDMLKLITNMDDIADLMEDVAETVSLYDVTATTDEAKQLAAISVACCERVHTIVHMLSEMKNASEILKVASEIERLESDADRVLRTAMSKLFREEDNVKNLIKYKAIYELLESITDKCEDVANIIQGIVVENA